ncbi:MULTISPECIES: hypothetical protein [Bacillota]|nr:MULTISPECIES: hypothetical protein [Peptoniphilaceae]MDK7722891.1 hypothetical protein [Peptoniphilus lacrimalis]MDK7732493.1 hypothetical protein [Peptoniphilus lacrimalis]
MTALNLSEIFSVSERTIERFKKLSI